VYEDLIHREAHHLYSEHPHHAEGRRLSEALSRLRHAERLQAERAVRASGLSGTDLTALRYLVQARRDERDVSPKDLIVMLGSTSATVTNVVERLVRRSLVRRTDHPTDRRAHFLVPTDEAERLVHRVFELHHAAVVHAIDEMDPAAAEAAAEAIVRITDSLDRLRHSDQPA
jgi:DNA-binding MarR family transcriptional regulator